MTVVKLYEWVSAAHPLRANKAKLDTVIQKLSPEFDELHEELECPSMTPEQLLTHTLSSPCRGGEGFFFTRNCSR